MFSLKTKKQMYQDYLYEIEHQGAMVERDYNEMGKIDERINQRLAHIKDLQETAEMYAPEKD